MFNRLLMTACCLFLAACSLTPPQQVQLQVQQAQTPLAYDLAQALAQSSAAALRLDTRRAHRAFIDPSAPRLVLNNEHSNYRTFSIQLRAGQPYSLHVISDCISCSGHTRYGLKPVLFLLDAQGNLINDQPSDSLSGRHGVSLRLTGTAPHEGTFYLLVAADNRNLGDAIELAPQQGKKSPTLSQQTPSPMRSYPSGEVRVFANSRS